MTSMLEAAEVPATRMVRCLTGVSLRKDEEGLVELPSYFTKRSLYKRFMYEGGWVVKTNAKGNYVAATERDDEHWTADDKLQALMSWTSFRIYWREHFPNLRIRSKSEDVCGECQIVAMRMKYNTYRLFVNSGSILPNTDAAENYDILKDSWCKPCEEEGQEEGDGVAGGGSDGGEGNGGRSDGGRVTLEDEIDDDDKEEAANLKADLELLTAALEHVKAADKQRVTNGLLDFGIAHLVGVTQNGHHQAAFGTDRDTDIEIIVVNDILAVDRRVDRGETLQRFDRSGGEKGHHAQLDAMRLLEGVAVGGARVHHRLQVYLVEGGQHRRRVLRLFQALGDELAQARHAHPFLAAAILRPGRKFLC